MSKFCGIEAEVFPDEAQMEPMEEILADYDWDFVLGSLHAHCASYHLWLKSTRSKSMSWTIDCYFRHLIDGVQSGRYRAACRTLM